MAEIAAEKWGKGALYERYMARWSRRIAPLFVEWLAIPLRSRWLDVGCGTGVLSATIAQQCQPSLVVGADLSEDFVNYASRMFPKVSFVAASAVALPLASRSFDVAASGLTLNFVPNAARALEEMRDATVAGGNVAVYVWDYAERMGSLRLFFDAAIAVNPAAAQHDEGARFPICRPDGLRTVFEGAGLQEIVVAPIETTAHFVDFEDYWQPFVGGGGFPAAQYLMAQSSDDRAAIRVEMERRINFSADGSFDLPLRAWAGQGSVAH